MVRHRPLNSAELEQCVALYFLKKVNNVALSSITIFEISVSVKHLNGTSIIHCIFSWHKYHLLYFQIITIYGGLEP